MNPEATLPKLHSFRNNTDSMREIWENGSQTALLLVFICSILTGKLESFKKFICFLEVTTAMMHSEYIDWKKSIRLLPQEGTHKLVHFYIFRDFCEIQRIQKLFNSNYYNIRPAILSSK
jgi:hypothetical protein